MQITLRLIDSIGAVKVLEHLKEINENESDLLKLERGVLNNFGIAMLDMQKEEIRSTERHLALLCYTKFAKEEVKLENINIATNLHKSIRTIDRYIANYKDYENNEIAIAKQFNLKYNQIFNKIKEDNNAIH